MSISEVVVFLTQQSFVVRAAVYIVSLLFLSAAGGFALSRLIGALGGALSALSSKEDVLQLFAVAVYSTILIAIEPAVRTLASSVGSALVTSLILAPIAGLLVLGARGKPESTT